jgi:hypothetical protein
MIDPLAELLRSGDTEALAELYECTADVVAAIENIEYSGNAENYLPQSMIDLVTLFNRCESARLEFRKRCAEMAENGDDEPAILTGKGGLGDGR